MAQIQNLFGNMQIECFSIMKRCLPNLPTSSSQFLVTPFPSRFWQIFHAPTYFKLLSPLNLRFFSEFPTPSLSDPPCNQRRQSKLLKAFQYMMLSRRYSVCMNTKQKGICKLCLHHLVMSENKVQGLKRLCKNF